MKLVVIESPGKEKTLKKYLGEGYTVFASKGHVRDLPEKSFGINLNSFEPEYETLPDKKALITELKKVASKADEIYLATDPDREGEAISWHLAYYLGLKPEQKCRIEFNEISKSAVEKALTKPRTINQNLVDAQQTRRILDRIVGYKISPIICKKIKPKISAGRVQSVSLKLVVDREKEIKEFKPEEYWNISVDLKKPNDKLVFKANLTEQNGKKIKVTNEAQAQEITQGLENANYLVKSIKKAKTKTKAPAPFTTSTMQQEALNKLGMALKKTSSVAQNLYEGVEIPGEGKIALITYIRSDSTRVSEDAQKMAKDYILQKLGKNYYPAKPNTYGVKASAQDAHEAIRPISLARNPESLKGVIASDLYKLYKLIYDRFLASQMSQAEYDSVTVDINAKDLTFRASGRTMTFAGWTAVYKQTQENEEEQDNSKIPPLEKDDGLNFVALKKEQKFTKPPARYTEASLVKAMEELGIGRPATYSPTITLLQSREYVLREGKFLYPSELGTVVSEYLDKYFKKVINVKFTAQMESRLDDIAEKGEVWKQVVENFWESFKGLLTDANLGEYAKIEPVKTDIKCEKCGALMYLRDGKYGKFLGCSNYPNCKNIQPLPENKPVDKGICPDCGKPTQMRKSKKGKVYFSCSGYPACQFMSWDEPTGKRCPKCNNHIIVKQYKDKQVIKCSNNGCDYSEK